MPNEPRTEAGKRLVEELGEHAPWFVGGSASAELEYVLNIEAEACAALLDAAGAVVRRWDALVLSKDGMEPLRPSEVVLLADAIKPLRALLDDHKKGAARDG